MVCRGSGLSTDLLRLGFGPNVRFDASEPLACLLERGVVGVLLKVRGELAAQTLQVRDNVDQFARQDRIKLSAGTGRDLGERLVDRDGLPANPRLRHDVEGVAQGDNASGLGDGMTGKSIGFTVTCPALMMGAGGLDGVQVGA